MGSGIAQVCAASGRETYLYDVTPDLAQRGLDNINKTLDKAVELKKATAEERAFTLKNAKITADLDLAVRGADLVIEAIPEKLDLKKSVFRRIAGSAAADAILATNTSSLSITQIADAVSNPARFIGMHFFNPVPRMQLLEIVRGELTSDDTIEKSRAFAESIGKTPILVKDSPGFASSRLGIMLGVEAIRMVEADVATAADIDTAMKLGYGHPMGPLELTDLVGLDVRLAIAEYLHRAVGEQFRPPELLKQMVAEGKLGRKSGKGFYNYPQK
ncbi:MAG: 3-hydroxyacyl-CoA dehydrogenase family protein [Planctomycetes bacterium]|nr:3-hydroxyacyl-CoA dehydrogenase family protein [Planctomycetota bacterium]